MNKQKPKGKWIFILFIILSILAAMMVSLFPVVEKYAPDLAKRINSVRGYYDGPLFAEPDPAFGELAFSEKYHGFRLSMKQNQIFRFIPAADITMEVSAYYETGGELIELYLYRADDLQEPLTNNLGTPYMTGRMADSYSQMGEEMPEHGNFFEYDYKKDTAYAIKAIPKNEDDYGQKYTIKMSPGKPLLSLQSLWVIFEITLVLLIILYLVIKAKRYRKKQ